MAAKWSLRVVLPVATAAVVAAVAIAAGLLAVRLLRSFGEEQALARVHAAGLAALREVAEIGEELDVAVRLLAERPTLLRHVAAGDRAARDAFLGRFAATGGLDACAVLDEDVPDDPALPWPAIADLRSPRTPGEPGWALLDGAGGRPVVAGVRPLADAPGGARVACARRLDDATAHELSERVGLPVAIVRVSEARARAGDALAVLRGRAADDGVGGAARVDGAGAFVDAEPIVDRAGRVVGLVETRLGTSGVDDSVARLMRNLWRGTALAAGVAAVAGLVLARRLVRPLGALAQASTRIGAGDLDSPIPSSSGAEIGVLADTMEDMRGRLLRVTSELRRRHAEADAILTGIVEGVWTVDRERRITWMNPQAAARLGIRAEDAAGRFCGDVLHPESPGGVRPCESHCPILDARFRGSARATEHLVGPDGDRRTVVITSSQVGDDVGGDDRESRQFQVLRDETDVEAARRLRDAVLANVSHEFRTPLSAQLASLEMLRERLGAGDADAGRLVRSMERGTLRLVRLVDNLLESLRIDAGRDSIRVRALDLGDVVDEAVEQVLPLLEQKAQTLDLRVPRPLPTIAGDAPRLVQVFTNLLANASKFAPVATSIAIRGETGPHEVTVWVEDRGPGFPDEPDERLFERFSRASGDEPEERGMGLGLYIAHSIVQRHGGTLRARNTGSGAWIAVVLPRAVADEDPGR